MAAMWRKQHFLLVDAALVTIVVVIASIVVHLSVPTEHLTALLNGMRTTFYSTASAGCGALLGFIITMTTITDAVIQNPRWERFRQSRAYSQVQDIYFNTIRWLGVSTLLFLVFLVVDTDRHPQLVCEAGSVWLICILTIRMRRSINALEMLLRMNSFKMKESRQW